MATPPYRSRSPIRIGLLLLALFYSLHAPYTDEASGAVFDMRGQRIATLIGSLMRDERKRLAMASASRVPSRVQLP